MRKSVHHKNKETRMDNSRYKFRAWHKESKKMYQPIAGLQLWNETVWLKRNLIQTFESVELMQYTGLKDKNGKEIFEGDVVDTGEIGIVKWRKYGFEQEMIFSTGWWVIQEQGEIIGNVWEHPKLII